MKQGISKHFDLEDALEADRIKLFNFESSDLDIFAIAEEENRHY